MQAGHRLQRHPTGRSGSVFLGAVPSTVAEPSSAPVGSLTSAVLRVLGSILAPVRSVHDREDIFIPADQFIEGEGNQLTGPDILLAVVIAIAAAALLARPVARVITSVLWRSER